MRLMILLINKKKKVEELTGIAEIGRLMQNKRVRWAASVYVRHMPELREVAKPIQSRWDGVRYAYNQYILIYRENMEILFSCPDRFIF